MVYMLFLHFGKKTQIQIFFPSIFARQRCYAYSPACRHKTWPPWPRSSRMRCGRTAWTTGHSWKPFRPSIKPQVLGVKQCCPRSCCSWRLVKQRTPVESDHKNKSNHPTKRAVFETEGADPLSRLVPLCQVSSPTRQDCAARLFDDLVGTVRNKSLKIKGCRIKEQGFYDTN